MDDGLDQIVDETLDGLKESRSQSFGIFCLDHFFLENFDDRFFSLIEKITSLILRQILDLVEVNQVCDDFYHVVDVVGEYGSIMDIELIYRVCDNVFDLNVLHSERGLVALVKMFVKSFHVAPRYHNSHSRACPG